MSQPTVTITPRVREHPDLVSLVETASPKLEGMLAESAEPVAAEWDLIERGSQRRPALALRLTDSEASLTALLEPDEIRNRDTAEWRFSVAFRELLGDRVRAILAKNRLHPTAAGE